jgi:hypothetical protein
MKISDKTVDFNAYHLSKIKCLNERKKNQNCVGNFGSTTSSQSGPILIGCAG